MICKSCGKDADVIRVCAICKGNVCVDCIRYVVVKRKTLYKEYEESIPVCKDCLRKVTVKKRLVDIVNEVLGD